MSSRILTAEPMVVIPLGAHAKRLEAKQRAGHKHPYPYDNRTTELLAMLRAKRPAGSATEYAFVDQWITPLGTTPDYFGNHWLTIGDSPIMWSCHTDTVHSSHGTQYVGFTDGCAYVTRSNCLGADDTVGCWIMRQMILAGVPGTYVFHREEEVGGLGSRWVLDNTPERLEGIQYAIAFDRRGYGDIITDQMGSTASEAFAESLAAALVPLDYAAAFGVFTDTQVYSDVIPECSNISVGYHNEHTKSEWLDIDFAMRLLGKILAADFSELVVGRDPEAELMWWKQDRYGERGLLPADDAWSSRRRGSSLDEFCRQYPDVVSDFLTSCGYDLQELQDYGGIV